MWRSNTGVFCATQWSVCDLFASLDCVTLTCCNVISQSLGFYLHTLSHKDINLYLSNTSTLLTLKPTLHLGFSRFEPDSLFSTSIHYFRVFWHLHHTREAEPTCTRSCKSIKKCACPRCLPVKASVNSHHVLWKLSTWTLRNIFVLRQTHF